MGKNSPIFEATIDRLVPCPHPCLHCQLLSRGDVVEWALYLVGVPTVAIIGLDAFIALEEVGEDGIKNLDVRPLTGGVRTLNPDKVTPRMSMPSLYCRADLPAYLWDAKGFPFFACPFWGIRKSVPSTDIRQLLPMSSTNLISKSTCNFMREGSKK